MESIKDTLESVMQAWEKKIRGSPRDNPELLLKKCLTKKESGHIKFRYFKKGVLSLNVDSSSWLYYFNLQKEDLLNRLRKQSASIRDIRFYIGEI
jgi:hypothetical protein